ncbi:hypothetical protein ACJIZ3_007434 [Penstemon smallii]|uniref:Uncharacterized protein n=1 Tax=Penstemon smallii TaxID=265156 RepID=A0ABD3SAH3_9LAMI
MSAEGVNSSADLQVWNNAAFDNGGSEDMNAVLQSWGSLKSIFGNPNTSFDSVSEKENQGPPMENQISSDSSLNIPFKPLNTDRAVEKSRTKGVSIKGFLQENRIVLKQTKVRDEKKIDEEIEEIESEISLLRSKLEALRLEKAERSVKIVEKRGKIVSSKFMGQKESFKNDEEKKKIEALSARTKVQRRGLSLGPVEIVSAAQRGMSLGPSEIFSSVKSKQLGRQEMNTPVQNRRKSCFYKLQGIEEEIGKSLSVSPKSRKLAVKNQVSTRQAVTTIASRKLVKKEDGVINSIQAKKLFKDGEKSISVTNKKPSRPGKVVASRYNQNTSQASAMRKRSLPENNDVNDGKSLGTESRVKKRWEIPNEIIVHGCSEESEKLSPEFKLPRITIARLRNRNESPRDSGPAKRVVELIGKKQFFANEEEVEASVCQALDYADDGIEES